MTANEATLREKRATVTRDHTLGAAFELLVEHPERPFSHEAVAKAAGGGARTVYRYFPAQADLFEALWLHVRTQSGTPFCQERAAPRRSVSWSRLTGRRLQVANVQEYPPYDSETRNTADLGTPGRLAPSSAVR